MANKEATLLLKIQTMGGELIDKLHSSFESLKEIAEVTFAAISAVVVRSVEAYQAHELAVNELSRAMVNQGLYTRELKDTYLEQADALQKVTVYGHDQVIAAEATLQAYMGQKVVTQELLKATLDLAAGKHLDLAQAAELVGKTIGTETDALKRQGVVVNETASAQEKMGQIIQFVNGHFKDQAATAADGLGALKQLKNTLEDLFEAIGQRIAPVVILFASKLKALAEDTKTTGNLLDTMVTIIHGLVNAGIIVSGVMEAVGAVIGNTLGGALLAVSDIANRQFGAAMDAVGGIGAANAKAVSDAYKNAAQRMEETDAAFLVSKKENLVKEENLEAESQAKRSAVALEASNQDAIRMRTQNIAQQQIDMGVEQANFEDRKMAQLDAQIKMDQEALTHATTSHQKLALLNDIYWKNEQKGQMIHDKAMQAARADTYATIATMASSSNSSLAAIGKAAGIVQIAIATPIAISKALSAFPPPFNFAAAGLVGAAMAVQAAQIAGVQLAEGGIVMPQPGGVQATIAEAGQAEAVIPLNRMSEFTGGSGGGGNTIVINAYGGLLGNESDAREFAKAVDQQLLRLRQNHESVAFDSGVV